MMCDGVVEYSYERNNIRIYGDAGNWDISAWADANKNHHSYFAITPKAQANTYMMLFDRYPD